MGNQGSPDRTAGPICVDRVAVSACEVWVPLAALAIGSVEGACSPHLPADPISDVIIVLGLWRTGAAVLAVGVTGPSLPVCPLVTTIMSSLSNSSFTSYSLPDQTAQGARYRPNTGCVNASFDQSLSSISQSRFCVQSLCALAQVALAYLDVSKTFCFPGIASGTVSPGPIPKYTGRATKGGCGVSVFGVGRASRVSYCCLGGFLFHWLTRARMRFGVLYLGTLSARDVGVPRPAGSLTARVLGNSGLALPWVSTCLSPLFVLRQSSGV